MGNRVDSLDGFSKVARNEIFDNGERELVTVRLEAREFGDLFALVFTSDGTSNVPSIFEESEGDVGCDESGDTGNEDGLGAGHGVVIEIMEGIVVSGRGVSLEESAIVPLAILYIMIPPALARNNFQSLPK